jgi:hypothetical protein
MRVGVYVDGFNLYYGARGLAGRGTPGGRWLDLCGLAADLVGRRSSWAGAEVTRLLVGRVFHVRARRVRCRRAW